MALFDRDARLLAASPAWISGFVAPLEELLRSRLGAEAAGRDPIASADGSVRWLEWRARPWLAADGEIGGTIVSCVDVTARIEAERRADELARLLDEARRQAEAAERRLKGPIDAIPGGFALYDRDDRLVDFNEASRAHFPGIADEIRRGASYEHLLRLGFDRGDSAHGAADEEAWLRERLARHRNPTGPIEQRTEDGRWLRIEESRMTDGGTLVIRTDVSDLKARERELASKSSLLEATLGNMGEGILVYGADARLIIANDQAARLLDAPRRLFAPGAALADLIGFRAARGDYGAVGVEDAVERRMARFHAGKPWRGARRLPGGSVVESSVNPMPDGAGAVFVLQDVTERADREARMADALAKAEHGSRAKSEFLAMASHELRTPMNAIIGLSGLLRERIGAAAEERYAATIEAAGESLLIVIDDLLEFASLDAKPAVSEAAPFDVRGLIASAIDIACPPARIGDVTIVTECGSAVPAALVGDGQRLRRTLVNLLDNAVKHTDRGVITVRARTREALAGGAAMLRVEVEDTGTGFAEGETARLFEPFERGLSGDRTRAAGLGLGLAVCRKLVDLMGGTIGAESRLGEGSCFWFEVPVGVAAPLAMIEAGVGQERSLAPRLRILVAEDIEANRAVIGGILDRLGHETHFAEDGAQAIEAARNADFDVILMDIQMPNVDGLTATRTIRGLGRRFRRIPIIAVSAYSQPVDKEAAYGAGVSGFLTKPVRQAQLDAALRTSTEKV